MGSSSLLKYGHQTGRPISYVFPIQAMNPGELHHFIKKERTTLAAQVSEQRLKMQSPMPPKSDGKYGSADFGMTLKASHFKLKAKHEREHRMLLLGYAFISTASQMMQWQLICRYMTFGIIDHVCTIRHDQ